MFDSLSSLCVEPVLEVNKAAVQSWAPGCADERWEGGGTRSNSETAWKSRTLLSAMPCPPHSSFPPHQRCLPTRALQGGFAAAGHLGPASRGDSSKHLDAAILFGCPSCEELRCLKLH